MWGTFRLENEHLNNFEGFRKMVYMPLRFDPYYVKPKTKQRIHVAILEIVAVILLIGALCGIAATQA